MSSASDPQGPGDLSRPAEDEAAAHPRESRPKEARDPDLLGRVLAETSEICGVDEPLDEADAAALREVARRFHGQPLVLDPIGVELVQTLLRSHFPAQPHDSQLWQAIAAKIALTLMDDPTSRKRLEALWVGLGGAAAGGAAQ